LTILFCLPATFFPLSILKQIPCVMIFYL
jgi:hypothetical protein